MPTNIKALMQPKIAEIILFFFGGTKIADLDGIDSSEDCRSEFDSE